MLFSFISTVYNQQDYIYSHMESIKHQIVTYGKEYEFELVICDDNSTDETVDYVRKWLVNNSNIFKVIKILTSEVNEGIVRNYIKGLKSFEGDFFHSLGGDDLYSSANLFECVQLLKEYDIVQGSVLEFQENKITTRLGYECFLCFQSINNEEFRESALRGKFRFMTPGIFYRKELITNELLEYLMEFKMFEDWPLYYFLLRHHSLKITYHQTTIVLYRISSSSVSMNKNHKCRKDLVEDNCKFFSGILKHADTPLKKMYINYWLSNLHKSRFRYFYKFNPFTIRDKFNLIFRHFKYRKSYQKHLSQMILKNEVHILKCSNNPVS